MGAAILPNRVALPRARPAQFRKSSFVQNTRRYRDRRSRAFDHSTYRRYRAYTRLDAFNLVYAARNMQGEILRTAAAR